MKKLLLATPLLLVVPFITMCGKSGRSSRSTVGDEEQIDVTLDKNHRLDGGDITINNTYFHFDENSVIENPSDPECFIEIGPYGSLYLQNYVPGLTRVFVKAKSTVDYQGEFSLGTSATPNCVEHYYMYSMTTSFIDMTPDKPYFSIHNHAGYNLLLEYINIKGAESNEEKQLKSKIDVHDLVVKYEKDAVVDPYQNSQLKEEDIPENRIVKKIGEDSYTLPGKYTYGYEVYNKTKDGELGKMLYSSKATLSIEGGQNNGEHLAIFHLKDGIATVTVPNNQKVDLSSAQGIASYNWDSPYNDFMTPFYADRHYYPAYSVVGMPVNKDGDGCMPITTTYSALEKTFVMPDPVMDDGYKFGGWFLDQELTKPLDPDGEYDGNMTVYANCIETEKDFRKVYYHDYDGKLLDHVDYLYDNSEINLPAYQEVGTRLGNNNQIMYAVVMGSNNLGMLRAKGNYPEYGPYGGDKLSYDLVKENAGDVHLYISKFEFYYDGPGQFSRFFQDENQNDVISSILMPEQHQGDDYVLPGRYIFVSPKTHAYDYDIYAEPKRSDEFFVTEEMNGYIMDQSTYTSICTYGYGNKSEEHAKPLGGILRHESVLKVGRIAFFNRYGLKGTYFPRNAREFDVESYAHTEFNSYLFLPKNLTKIGKRAFVGSKNIQYVALPKTIKTIEKDAFSLGEYDETACEFKNVTNRTNSTDLITFYYEGTQDDYNRLDEATRQEIENNALRVICNVKYNVRYGR